MELLAQYPGIYKHFRHCNCIIYASLTKSEVALFAHDDYFDAEVRRKYTYHERVEYFYRQFMEAKQTGESMAALRKRLALETMNISEDDSKTALSTLEGTFQVAFRTRKLWDVQESIFRKFERKELKSMKAAGKVKKKDDGEMRPTWWRPLQSVSDERKLSILLHVDAGELALDQMSAECERCRSKEQGHDLPQPVQTFKTWAKEGSLKSVEWDVFHHDVPLHAECCPKQKYTLAIADVPYGFQLKDCSHNDSKPFLKNNVLDMLTQVGLVSSSSYWTLVIFHNLQQAPDVAEAFKNFGCKSCSGVWVKPNIKNSGGPRMTQNSEYWTVGFWSANGKMWMAHFGNCTGFPETVVLEPHSCVLSRGIGFFVVVLDCGDLSQLTTSTRCRRGIQRFWLQVLACGSRTTPVCALQGGRNCVAIELDKRQYLFLASRVYNMKKLPDANMEVTRGHKHSSNVGPLQNDGEAEINEVAHKVEDDPILLHNDDGAGSIGTQEDEHGSTNEEELEELPGQSKAGEADAGAKDADSAPLVVGDSLATDPIEMDP
ncbi:hypothetical protein R1sor_020851 [Riccia sorocarpa]|uniref:Uncharacterized protein n=1 Tax=Riccia sorocarpa TaxID=122646 RepID=A0ABD3GFD1_9MARC